MDAVISIDAAQRIVLFNPAAERMFGVSSGEALGQPLERFIPERFRVQHAHDVEHFGETGVSARRMGGLGMVFGLRANGQEFPIEASISQIELHGEKLFTVILRDITNRKKAEEALHQAGEALLRANVELERKVQERTAQLVEANANLQTFTHAAAHDLRSPLRTIDSFTGLALEDFGPKLDPECRSHLERVSQAAQTMGRLMNDLLEYSRMERAELKLDAISLQSAVQDALALLEAEIRATQASVTIQEPLPAVIGHRATVVLIIHNLLSNALKFVAVGVQPQVRLWAEDSLDARGGEGDAQKTADEQGARVVRLWVEDNGIGIPPEQVAKLFRVFQRLHSRQTYPGTGLGLAMVRRGVERMGGRTGVESELGKGSRFWVELQGAK
jgi:PAS domain S-box-containing protein